MYDGAMRLLLPLITVAVGLAACSKKQDTPKEDTAAPWTAYVKQTCERMVSVRKLDPDDPVTKDLAKAAALTQRCIVKMGEALGPCIAEYKYGTDSAEQCKERRAGMKFIEDVMSPGVPE